MALTTGLPRHSSTSTKKDLKVLTEADASALQSALARIEAKLQRVEAQILQNAEKIRLVAEETMATRRLGTIEKLHNRVVGIEEMVNLACLLLYGYLFDCLCNTFPNPLAAATLPHTRSPFPLQVRNALRYTSALTVRGVPLGSPLALAVAGSLLALAYFTRRSIYTTFAEESATLGKEVKHV